MQKHYLSAERIVNIIPDALLDQLSLSDKIDYSVKKLRGKTIFKLMLYSFLSAKTISLRILEAIYNSVKFKNLFNLPKDRIKHSGIGFRLSTVNYQYFENIFTYLVRSPELNEIIFADKKILARKIDSTLVLLSSKLLAVGMDDNPGKKTLKFSVEINEGIPVNIMLFKNQPYLSEENALPVIIKQKTIKNALNIAIFDKGIQKIQSFTEFDQAGIHFISRISTHKMEVIKNLPLKEKETKTLHILADQEVAFAHEKKTREAGRHFFRLITGRTKESGEIIKFITNVNFLSAAEITDLYRSRWEIENFFKFIKQEMNFTHLLSRTENGIKVVMYMTMITAILLTLYKKANKIIGWAVAKIKFLDELETELMYGWHGEMSRVFTNRKYQLSNNINSS